MPDIDEMVKQYEAADAWEDDDEVVEIAVKRPLDKVVPVRLSGDKWSELRRAASELGVGPSTLARIWIMERLRAAQSDPDHSPSRSR